MLRRIGLIGCWVVALKVSLLHAQTPPHPFELKRGLERFDTAQQLNVSSQYKPQLSIKGIVIGDNTLSQAIRLAEQGGQLGRIHGGSRSDKVTLSFDRAYENTRLEQKLELHFDKYNGFVHQVTATYQLADAYHSIVPVREQTLAAAIEKFGEPLTIQQVYEFSGKKSGDVSQGDLIKSLQKQLHPLGLEYFRDRNISRSTKWVATKSDYALLHSGFDRCYMWQTDTFTELLTLCFFDESGANANSRGVELNLHHFPIRQAIKDLGNPDDKPDILL